MAEIRVNSSLLTEKANNIKNISASIQAIENDISAQMSAIKPVWEGEASEKFATGYQKLSEELKGMYDTLGRYATFLEEASAGFAEAEQKAASSASGTTG
jgi:WXG100 family type VII secretion target